MPKLTVVLAFLAAASRMYARSAGMNVHELRERAPSDYAYQGPGALDDTLELQLALVQSNFPALEEALYAVSTPGSSRYGQHLSKEEVDALVAPASDSVAAVQAWLSSHGLVATPTSPSGDTLKVALTVSQANALLDTEFGAYIHGDTGKRAIRTMAYSVPSHLKSHIRFVHPTVAFPVVKSRDVEARFSVGVTSLRERDDVPESCNTTVTPACLQALYEIPTTLFSQTSTSIGITGFIGEFANEADLELYLTTYRPDIPPPAAFAFESVDGGQNLQNETGFGDEANIDVQMVMGLASGVPTTFISVGGDGNIGEWLDLANFLLGMDAPPEVVTTSYSFDEPDVPIGIATQICNAFAQLGARGTTVIFSSGDGGVSGGSPSDACTTFVPSFPSSCPYVTSVGATAFLPPEAPWSFTSGGFSNYFPQPAYQAGAVAAYLAALAGAHAGLYNASGRGFPDVSATGVDVAYAFRGQAARGGGTSFAAPIVAAVVGALNAERALAGNGSVGFLNPLLYANPGAFRDVVGGSNPGCGTEGFPAVEGWDPVTGMGTPLYSKLRAAVGL